MYDDGLFQLLSIRISARFSLRKINLMDIPSYRLHSLQGNRQGTWSVKVNGNWRITFRFTEQDIELIDHEDYH
nr:type II toxin-antitoxin system RelE/ParE family toxin [Thiothrix fructosivorans]